MGTVVLDSSLLIGFFDPNDPHHDAAARHLQRMHQNRDGYLLPTVVLAEVMVGRIRSNPRTARGAMQTVLDAFGPVREVDEEIAFVAAELRARRPSIQMPDALVVATATVEQATVSTFDKRLANAAPDRVQVIPAD
ncbi:hypothetical protein GCM10023321_19090 [Pseudonocardia eucalypti]|uniref:Ribonuclease VapC n=1 Tax=Pseudonocardia eucalypti TaxID=648755 RepID=A0ABP9PT68_9PSEU|nr:putative nucleic acid-binding protein [Pseudonocardia eucalypti]